MKRVCMLAALALSVAALPVHAEESTGSDQVLIESRILETTQRNELGIELFNQDTHAALPTAGPFIQPTSGSVLGLQLTYLHMLSALYVIANAGYGVGGETYKFGTPTVEDELRLKMVLFGMGLGYFAPVTRKVGIHTTLQLMYQSTVATAEFAGDEEDGPSYNALGLALAIGTSYQFAQRLKFRAELYNFYARGSIDEDEAEFIEWVKFSCYRMGVSHSF